MSYERPYDGLKVLDLSQGVAGPYCGTLLALYGADVIKIEPREGDWARKLGTDYGGHSVLDICGNRGKRSISLDLKHADGRAVAQMLAVEADVLIEGFRPGVADRLGLGYAGVKEQAVTPRRGHQIARGRRSASAGASWAPVWPSA